MLLLSAVFLAVVVASGFVGMHAFRRTFDGNFLIITVIAPFAAILGIPFLAHALMQSAVADSTLVTALIAYLIGQGIGMLASTQIPQPVR